MRTVRQTRGAEAENLAVEALTGREWRVLARNAKVGARDEIDIVAIDPESLSEFVCVEVRSARAPQFGAPEERVDNRKVGNLYRAARAFSRSNQARELGVGALAVRVDLVIVDLRGDTPSIRHLKRLEPA
jgi:Holliday junction resolvase-like predicted endonuclease